MKSPGWTQASLPRALLIAGPEASLREEAIAAVRAALGKDADESNWVVFHGPNQQNEADALTPATVLDEVCTRSMFADEDDSKAVLVRSADLLLATHHRLFEDNLEKIPLNATLVFEAYSYGKLKTSNFVKALAAKKAVIECLSLAGEYDNSALEDAVAERARARGLNLSHAALLLLISRSAKNLAVLEEELDKLALQLPGSAIISEEDVLECCSATNTFTAFNFVDALLARDARHALEILSGLFERGLADSRKPGKIITQDGAIAMVVLGALTWKLSQLQDIRTALDAGKPESAAFAEGKVFGIRADAARRQLRSQTSATLRRAMEALFVCNLELRRGGAEPRELLEQLVFKYGV